MAVSIRTKRHYTIAKSKLATDLLEGATVQEWSLDGSGKDGNIDARLADTNTPDTPVTGVTRVVENHRIIPFTEVYQEYFTSIQASQFNRATVAFNATHLVISLNLEEG